MLILGLSGGLDAYDEQYFCPHFSYSHDSAAVLIEDGQVVAAIEDERVSRIKHSNKFPLDAIRYCLNERRVALTDVDRIAYYWLRDYLDWANLDRFMDYDKPRQYANARQLFRSIFDKYFGVDVDDRLRFVNHHLCHATSAAACAGFDEALVCSIDGMGDTGSGLIAEFRDGALRTLREIPNKFSLGRFYVRAIGFIGYRIFDEYKVMGLAPYGDPTRFRDVMAKSYELLPDGEFGAWSPWLTDAQLHELTRLPGEPFLQIHQDWAAALQVALEDIVFHVLRHFRATIGLRNLALAGGVAHNCTMNGKILNSGLFDRVFVQPAAHDAGAALGAAQHVYYEERSEPIRATRLEQVYWGTDIGPADRVRAHIQTWTSLLDYSEETDIVETAAELLANGAAIGWVQGRSEFGPRALGNRSILADPRPADNKGRINKMIKKREAYRPFAPTVLEECVSDYFVVPQEGRSQPFMTFVVDVQPAKRELLGAITHVDGTARVQTVSRTQNARYWALVNAFGDRTGVPMLLNTSFNNNDEPIVDSVVDAIVCYLTTDLDYLILGEFVITKKKDFRERFGGLIPALPRHISLSASIKPDGTPAGTTQHHIRTTFDPRKDYAVDATTFRALEHADGRRTLDEIADAVLDGVQQGRHELLESMDNLWSRRLITMTPRAL
jgi:carbamoyltransferase